MRTACAVLLILCGLQGLAQDLDVKSYDLIIRISDSSNVIHVTETIRLTPMASGQIELDLYAGDEEGLGMNVTAVELNGESMPYQHAGDKLSLAAAGNGEQELKLVFNGVPADGLIIGRNMYGNRTFFGDNWPNRAHHWFACNDHPSDKATVSFSIIAPAHYGVIANGLFKGSTRYENGERLSVYASQYELPTKVMVFGAADFAVEELTEFTRFPLSSWVYPENKEAGFYDLKLAMEVLDYMEQKITAYPYEKLANVQSTTRYGGMENAGCIFYAEKAITGKRKMEELIAHEIAHQWFGNSASETDWDHLWLSEGFATFLTHAYIEHKYGTERYISELEKDRQTVLQFYNAHPLPLVDTLSTEPLFQLNANAYQRGAWVLHMLRIELGDEAFWSGVRAYYEAYKYANASSDDFIRIMEQTSGRDLSVFDRQWLRTGAIPELNVSWKAKKKKLQIALEQKQNELFSIPVQLEIVYADDTKELLTVNLTERLQVESLKAKSKVKRVNVDPYARLLYRGN